MVNIQQRKERHWDSFRSVPRSEREADNDTEKYYTYWLQCVKVRGSVKAGYLLVYCFSFS